jgi:hypothetical protein
MRIFDDGSGESLFVGGNIGVAVGVLTSGIGKWNGTTWSHLGTGTGPDPTVHALAVFDDGTGDALYVGGHFLVAGGVTVNRVAKWNGSVWSPLGTGMDNLVNAVAVFDDGSGSALYAGGGFTTAGGITARNLAKWHGGAWSAMDSELNDWVETLVVFDDGGGDALYAGGHFLFAGGTPANRVAKWNGCHWSPLGGGITGGPSAVVKTLSVLDDGTGEALYAGGQFSTAGGVAANNIAKWSSVYP